MRFNKKQIFFFASATLILSTTQLNAQSNETVENEFQASFQFRPRLEIRDGAFRPLSEGEKPSALISDRARLKLDYKYKDILELRVAPQSVGVWGQANMVQGAENSGNRIALFETWAKLNLHHDWSMKLGRQVISLDDERFFGELDWAQGGRAHDALQFNFKKEKIDLKTFFAYNQNYAAMYGNNLSNPSGNLYSPADALPYKWMQTIWAGITLNEKSKLSLLITNLGMQYMDNKDTTVNFTQTIGANYFYKGSDLNGSLTGYYQLGKDMNAVKTNAFLLAAQIGYQFNSNFNLNLGSDYLSGNKLGTAQDKNYAFNPYFHTGHKFYGSMDYFYSGNGHKNVGLSDNYLKLNYARNNYSINLALHQFFATASILEGNIDKNKNLGQEMDLTVLYKINPVVSLVGGYSFFINSSTLNYLKDVPTANSYQQWAWVSLNITPKFFKSKF